MSRLVHVIQRGVREAIESGKPFRLLELCRLEATSSDVAPTAAGPLKLHKARCLECGWEGMLPRAIKRCSCGNKLEFWGADKTVKTAAKKTYNTLPRAASGAVDAVSQAARGAVDALRGRKKVTYQVVLGKRKK